MVRTMAIKGYIYIYIWFINLNGIKILNNHSSEWLYFQLYMGLSCHKWDSHKYNDWYRAIAVEFMANIAISYEVKINLQCKIQEFGQ